jgi:two-component system sensor histidine kinase KdpD
MPRKHAFLPTIRRHAGNYLAALSVPALCTAVVFPIYPRFNVTNVAMLYVLGTKFVALRLGLGPAIFTSVVNILLLDYFFIPPIFSLDVADMHYAFTLGVMLIVAIMIAKLMVTVRRHGASAEAREWRTSVLYSMCRELCVASDAKGMAAVAQRHIDRVLHGATAVIVTDERGNLTPLSDAESPLSRPKVSPPPFNVDVVRNVIERRTRHIEGAVYLPLQGRPRVKGVLVVHPHSPLHSFSNEQLNLLDAFASQLALALQRAQLARAAEHAALRNTLLSSVSHDLRTPLSAIAGAGSLIAQPDYVLNDGRRATLGQLIERKAHDMSHLLSNVLELARMEFGAGPLRADWHSVDELVAHSLRVNGARLTQRRVEVKMCDDLPLILVDATLMVQILNNLLENSAKYTPPGTTITISAAVAGDNLLLVVADDGPGLPAGDPDRLFEKYQRGDADGHGSGVGLGLAICRAAARLHGGDIRASDTPGGGATFEIRVPVQMLDDRPASLEVDCPGAPA